jgi:hypothetical protein
MLLDGCGIPALRASYVRDAGSHILIESLRCMQCWVIAQELGAVDTASFSPSATVGGAKKP